jgi:hypothetical protein
MPLLILSNIKFVRFLSLFFWIRLDIMIIQVLDKFPQQVIILALQMPNSLQRHGATFVYQIKQTMHIYIYSQKLHFLAKMICDCVQYVIPHSIYKYQEFRIKHFSYNI